MKRRPLPKVKPAYRSTPPSPPVFEEVVFDTASTLPRVVLEPSASRKRPELVSNFRAERYYDAAGSKTYHTPSNEILQFEITQAVQQFIKPPAPSPTPDVQLRLDLGSGSGFSIVATFELAAAPKDLFILGCDVSMDMLGLSKTHLTQRLPKNLRHHVDLVCCDFGQGLPFRADLFDAAVSISALQWLNTPVTQQRLFRSLQHSLKPAATAVFQFYPETSQYLESIIAVSRESHLQAATVMDMMHHTLKQKWVHVARKPALPLTGTVLAAGPSSPAAVPDARSSCLDSSLHWPMSWCLLSFPFFAPCSLELKRHLDVEVPANCGGYNLARGEKLPLSLWLKRAHGEYAVQLMYAALKLPPRIPDFKPKNQIHLVNLAVRLVPALVQLLGTKTPTWLLIQTHIDRIIDILHSLPPPTPESLLWGAGMPSEEAGATSELADLPVASAVGPSLSEVATSSSIHEQDQHETASSQGER
jgi:SAM-dependent methyltransferase